MSSTEITVDNTPFTCQRLSDVTLLDVAVVYVIICVGDGGKWNVIDVGQSGEAGTRLGNHPRRECWEEKCPNGNIWVCVHPMPSKQFTKQDRLDLERSIRGKRFNLCGDR